MYDSFNSHDIRYCSEEVTRQLDSAMNVYHMSNALMWLRESVLEGKASRYHLDTSTIITVGHLIKPGINILYDKAFRDGEVTFPDGGTALAASEIPRRIDRFIDWWPSMEPEEAFQEFLYIHPFRDGNGRAGSLFFNLKLGSILKPVLAPEYKK